jgi:mannose-6-phosphate isomerase-like protein (cupin superfamily)
MPGAPGPGWWLFLGVLVDVLTEPGAPVTVAEAIVPAGASPPAHMHAALDDSFYVLEGRMVIRCGEDVWQAGPGSWVQFPARVPHTFRVMGGPARILMVHADESFMAAVREIGRPATGTDIAEVARDLTIAELDRAFAAHGITNVGPPMEQAEAEHLLGQLAAAATRNTRELIRGRAVGSRQTDRRPPRPASGCEQHQPRASAGPAAGLRGARANRLLWAPFPPTSADLEWGGISCPPTTVGCGLGRRHWSVVIWGSCCRPVRATR